MFSYKKLQNLRHHALDDAVPLRKARRSLGIVEELREGCASETRTRVKTDIQRPVGEEAVFDLPSHLLSRCSEREIYNQERRRISGRCETSRVGRKRAST